MNLKKIVNFNNSVRHQLKIQKNLLSKYNKISKNLTIIKKASGGRNNLGQITVRHIGAGCKKGIHKIILPKRFCSLVINVMYGALINSFISLNFDLEKRIFFKTLTTKSVYSGCLTHSTKILKDIKLGCRSTLRKLPSGIVINSVSLDSKVTFAKSAGTFCQIVEKKREKTKIKLPSNKVITISSNNYATIGSLDNNINKLSTIGKAGRNRLMGIRPSVRGIAMNPVDHPHGGKSNKGMPQVTPWGLPTKNRKTKKL